MLKDERGMIMEWKTNYIEKYGWDLKPEEEKLFTKIITAYFKRIKEKRRIRFNHKVGFHTVKLAGYEYVAHEPMRATIYIKNGTESNVKIGHPGDKGFGFNHFVEIQKCVLSPRYGNIKLPSFAPPNFKNKVKIVK